MKPENKNSRRDFVKTSALLTGGVMATPLLSKANFFSGAEDTIKVALIGCGGRGTGAAMQACLTKQNVKLVAMADAFRDRIDSCFKELIADNVGDGASKVSIKNRIDVPEERKYTGFDAYKKAIAHADVVILTTPPGFRPIHFEEAVNLGKQIFIVADQVSFVPGLDNVETFVEEGFCLRQGLHRKLDAATSILRPGQATLPADLAGRVLSDLQ